MKAISLTQPWAALVALGVKRFETRSWSTRYRGPLAIHAAKGYPKYARDFTRSDIHAHAASMRLDVWTFGAIIAIVDLMDVRPTIDFTPEEDFSTTEAALGDWTPGRFAWEFSHVRTIVPVPARGSLGLWEWKQ
jgi:hypothetical protein